MRAVNLYCLCQIRGEKEFSLCENLLSGRLEEKKIKIHEQDSLRALGEELAARSLRLKYWDGFFWSFTIGHIGKEFDLLKLSADGRRILNIELKSESVDAARIRRQLLENRYYLGMLTKEIRSYTFVSSRRALYTLDGEGELKEASFDELIRDLSSFEYVLSEGIEELFQARDFLISPVDTPQRFVEGQYFLTLQQEQHQERILSIFAEQQGKAAFVGLTGSAGTGKTLLLYDTARLLAEEGYETLVLHCGKLLSGQEWISAHLPHFQIRPVRELPEEADFSEFAAVFVDESQRLSRQELARITSGVRLAGCLCVLAFDGLQLLTEEGKRGGMSEAVEQLSHPVLTLSGRIRCNKDLAAFVHLLMESRVYDDRRSLDCAEVLYAENEASARELRRYYARKKRYTWISLAPFSPEEDGDGGRYESAGVLGREFDRVVMVLDQRFYYDEKGLLRSRGDKDPDDLDVQRLYQGITRAREKLCLIISGNPQLFSAVLAMKARHALHREP